MAESSGSASSSAAAAHVPLSGRIPAQTNACKNELAAATVGGRDNISNLPDDVLQHMLSFLPAQDAVRTCVLAKSWRHMWKSTTGLRLVCGGTEEVHDFVDHLLRLRIRGGTPLDSCQFYLDDYCSISQIILWIRLALQCKVRVLKFTCEDINYQDISPRDGQPLFISQYLKKLELSGLDLVPSGLLDFSFCTNLEDLEIVDCVICDSLLISSQSLKRLTIINGYFGRGSRMPISICALNLISLWLEVSDSRSPSLQSMPSLVTAVVKIENYGFDRKYSDFDDGYSNQSILLQALSGVRNLVLMSDDTKMFIFRRDLEFCSSFNNLKSLLIDGYWCRRADFSTLACLLKLSPVLEKLTLQLYSVGPKHKVEIKLSCKPLEISAEISRHLKTIEVKYAVHDKRINNVLTFFSKKLNIFRQIEASA